VSAIIPDPTRPEGVAIDGETGDLLAGVFLISPRADGAPPTLDDIAGGTHIGWTRGLNG
jgi:hypothetical protein